MKKIVSIVSIILLISISVSAIQSAGSGNWNNGATWVGGAIPGQNDDIEIVSGHAITLTADASVRNITITSGSIIIGSNTFSIYGNINGANSNNITSTANSSLEIQDYGSASIFSFPSNIGKLKKLTINRAAGALTTHDLDLDDAVPTDSVVLVLTNGVIFMNNNTIFYMNSQKIKRDIPCSDNSFIDGIVQRDIEDNTGFHVFPVGDNGLCRPMALGAQNGTSNINQVQFIFDLPPNSANVVTSKLPGGIFKNFYWDHQLISSANTRRRMSFKNSDFPNISDADISANIYLANSSGSNDWTIPTTPRDVDNANDWIGFQSANASNDRYWTFGSDNVAVKIDQIVLPIELMYFQASFEVEGISLEWATASELNNESFVIQRAIDGITFIDIETIPGAGTSEESIFYNYIDVNSNEAISYYRLKQIDYNGQSSYSNIISIEKKYSKILFNMIPLNNNIWECKVRGNQNTELNYMIISINGRILEENKIMLEKNSLNKFNINLGKYIETEGNVFVIVKIDNEKFQEKINLR